MEPDEEEPYKPRPKIVRSKKSTTILGQGVSARKVVLVVLTLAISLGSIFFLNQWQQDPVKPSAGPIFPVSKETLEQQEYVLFLINKERVKAELPEL